MTTGEHLHQAVGEMGQTGDFEDVVQRGDEVLRLGELRAQRHRAGNAFLHGQEIVGDAELRHIAQIPGMQILLLAQIATVPQQLALGLFQDAGDDFQQRRFTTAGRPDDGHQMRGRNGEGNLLPFGIPWPIDFKTDVVCGKHAV